MSPGANGRLPRMPKARPLPPAGAKPIAELPFFALRKANGGHFDSVVNRLYAAVDNVGGRPAGMRGGLYQFAIGPVQASVDLSTGLATVATSAAPQPALIWLVPAKAPPSKYRVPPETDFDVNSTLRYENPAWSINFLPDGGDRRTDEMNAAIGILRDVGQEYRHAVRQLLQNGAVNLYVRMSATSGFEGVYPDAVPGCCLDWPTMRLLLSDGRTAEQAMFTPALGRAKRIAGDGLPQEDDAQLCRRIGQAILDASPERAWRASEVISLLQELAPSLSEPVCQTIFTELKSALPEASPWRTGGRPPTRPLRDAVRPALVARGLIEDGSGSDDWRKPP